MVVTISHEGYIKRMPLTTYRRQGRGGQGIIGSDAKEGDFVEDLFIASTHDYLLFFTEQRPDALAEGVRHARRWPRQSKGRAIVNLLEMQSDEKICAVVAVREFDERFLVTATKRGQIKKTALAAYSNPRKGGINAIGLDEGDVVIGVAITTRQRRDRPGHRATGRPSASRRPTSAPWAAPPPACAASTCARATRSWTWPSSTRWPRC